MKLKPVLQIVGGLAVTLTLAPFIAADYWWIRIFDFPHVQLTVFTFFALLIYFIRFDIRAKKDYAFMIILVSCFVFQMGKIYPYTSLAKVEVLKSSKDDEQNSISILTINVLETNKQYQNVLNEIQKFDPEIIVLLEIDELWKNQIAPKIDAKFRYRVEEPLSNTYGILLYSKYKLINQQVKYLVDAEIPSVHAIVQLPSGQKIMLHAIHPTPPTPQHNPTSTDRDGEMQLIAKLAKEEVLPVIVAGDFNDVAWSRTTSLFQNVSGLLDPRKGRGFFSSYHADYMIMRWPLDHLFVSEQFRLTDISVGCNIGSDHFPYYTKLSFEPKTASFQKRDDPSKNEIKKSNSAIKNAKEDNI